eukprot:7541788-Pyramimonas_sp.AAC.1
MLMSKEWCFAINADLLKWVMRELRRRRTHEHQRCWGRIQGIRRSECSEKYPTGLSKKIAEAILCQLEVDDIRHYTEVLSVTEDPEIVKKRKLSSE